MMDGMGLVILVAMWSLLIVITLSIGSTEKAVGLNNEILCQQQYVSACEKITEKE